MSFNVDEEREPMEEPEEGGFDSMEEEAGEPPEDFHAGFVAVVGRPNVGKSTLINTLVGQKIAAVSPKPQTTRRQQLGILTRDDAQIIFIDTPGIHNPVHKLGEYMNETATDSLEDGDLVMWVCDASFPPAEEDILIANRLKAIRRLPRVLMALNKIDKVSEDELPARQEEFLALFPNAFPYQVSAVRGEGVEELILALVSYLPKGAPFYSPDEITDYYERDIAAELVREATLKSLRDEVPHGIAVRIDEFAERSEDMAYIAATIFVERESQKGIVIGQKGDMLKKIGSAARQEIERMSGRRIFLELRVKVNKNWRNNPDALRQMGYAGKSRK